MSFCFLTKSFCPNIIKNIQPIEENLIGTNGIKYRHIYYIAEIAEDYLPEINGNNEIGGMNIGNNCGIGAHSQLWSHIKYGDMLEGCRFLSEKAQFSLDFLPS